MNLKTCGKDISVAQQIAMKPDRGLPGDKWAMSSVLLAAQTFFEILCDTNRMSNEMDRYL